MDEYLIDSPESRVWTLATFTKFGHSWLLQVVTPTRENAELQARSFRLQQEVKARLESQQGEATPAKSSADSSTVDSPQQPAGSESQTTPIPASAQAKEGITGNSGPHLPQSNTNLLPSTRTCAAFRELINQFQLS